MAACPSISLIEEPLITIDNDGTDDMDEWLERDGLTMADDVPKPPGKPAVAAMPPGLGEFVAVDRALVGMSPEAMAASVIVDIVKPDV